MSQQTTEDSFFEGKRNWSVVKDKVIGGYVKPFVHKVAQRNRPILLIDAFAGPGVFDDGTPGSPLIICNAASSVQASWQAIFINRNKLHHEKLHSILEKGNWLSHAIPLLGDSTKQLRDRAKSLTNETVFLYLDPFGLKGCNFQVVTSYLERAKQGHRTEVVINMSMPTLHRLATPQAISSGKKDDPQVVMLNQTLSNALGGTWWQEIMWSEAEPQEKEAAIMERFASRLAEYLPYTGYCPVQPDAKSRVKYYITFATGHPDAQVIMNDVMKNAYENYIFEAEAKGQTSMFNWTTGRDLSDLESVILQTIQQHPNQPRKQIWAFIVQNHFMKWAQKEFNKVAKEMADKKRIIYPVDPQTGKRNEDCILSLPAS